MVVAVPLHLDNIKSFHNHHVELKQNGLTIYDFDPKATSLFNNFGISISLRPTLVKYISQVENFYASNSLRTLCLTEGNEYSGNVVLGVSPIEGTFLEKYAKPQNAEIFGEKRDSYLSIKKINMIKGMAPSEYYPAIVEAIEDYGFDEFIMTAPRNNKSVNGIFGTITKFCGGKILRAKDNITYIVKACAEKVKEAFKEIEMLKVLEENKSIQSIIEGITKVANAGKEIPEFLASVKNKVQNMVKEKEFNLDDENTTFHPIEKRRVAQSPALKRMEKFRNAGGRV